MSVQPTATGPISTISEPAAVRNGSPAVKRAWSEAVGFEEMLVSQLTQTMSQSAGLGEEGAEGEGSTTPGGGASLLTSMMPQTLAESISQAGGLGLASQLLDSIDPAARGATEAAAPSGASGHATGGVPA